MAARSATLRHGIGTPRYESLSSTIHDMRLAPPALMAAVLLCGSCIIPAAGIAAGRLPTLSAKTARYYSKVALRRNFNGEFYAGGFRADACQRRSRVRVRCRVGWFNGDFEYFGHTVIWFTADEAGTIWNYAYGITRLDTYCLQVLKKPGASCTKTYQVS